MPTAPTQIRSLARSHTKTAINTLAGIMNETSVPAAARVAAATALLDRGWGKAAQSHAGADGEGPIELAVRITTQGYGESND